jgi:hypothetical protein
MRLSFLKAIIHQLENNWWHLFVVIYCQGLVVAISGVHERSPLQINGELKGHTEQSGKDSKE